MRAFPWLELKAFRIWMFGLGAAAFGAPVAVYAWHRFLSGGSELPPLMQIQDASAVSYLLGGVMLLGYMIQSHMRARGLKELVFLSPGHALWETFGRFALLCLIWIGYVLLTTAWAVVAGAALFHLTPFPWKPLMMEVPFHVSFQLSFLALLVLWDKFALAFRIHRREVLASLFFICGIGAMFYWLGRAMEPILGALLPPIRFEHPLYMGGMAGVPQEPIWTMALVTTLSLALAWALARGVEL